MLALRAFLRAYGVQLGIGLAILFAVWFVYHKGEQAAERRAERAELARQAEERRLNDSITRAISDAVRSVEAKAHADLSAVEADRLKLTPAIQKELSDAPSLSRPGSLPGGVRDQLNRARSAGDSAPKR